MAREKRKNFWKWQLVWEQFPIFVHDAGDEKEEDLTLFWAKKMRRAIIILSVGRNLRVCHASCREELKTELQAERDNR